MNHANKHRRGFSHVSLAGFRIFTVTLPTPYAPGVFGSRGSFGYSPKVIATRPRHALIIAIALSTVSVAARAQPVSDAAVESDATVSPNAAVESDAAVSPDASVVTQASTPAPAETPPAASRSVESQQRHPDGPRTIVIDAAPIGVDPGAGTFVTNLIRRRVAELGFDVIPTEEFYDAARQLQMPFPVPPDGVFMLERSLRAPVAVTAEVRAAGGRYVVRLRVRVAVEPGERIRDVIASQWELAQSLRDALPDMLHPPELAPPTESYVPLQPATPPRRRRRVRAHRYRWELGFTPSVAFGPGRDSFVNALIGARLGFFPLDRLGLSLSVAYANLRARNDDRVSNVLLLAGIETSVDLWPEKHIFIPLRAQVGYLPNNGPVFRLTAGLAFRLARRVRLEVDLLSPTLWVLPETSPVTLDLGVSLHFGF